MESILSQFYYSLIFPLGFNLHDNYGS